MDVIKAHGTGNDFVVIPDREDRVELTPELVRALCDRHLGLGGDGVIRLAPPSDGGVVFMDYRNADGGIVEMCGNGVRVVARLVAELGWVDVADGDHLDVETRAGMRPVVVHLQERVVSEVSVDMGPPDHDHAASGFRGEAGDGAGAGNDTVRLDVAGTTVEIAITSMGNPHAVLLVDDVGTAPVTTLGPALETDAHFDAGVNVGFLQPVSRTSARLRVWERGVGETQACGTGACAAVAVGQHLGHFDDEVVLDVPGGRLVVSRDDAGHLHLRGPAEVVAHAHLDDAWLTSRSAPERDV